MGVAAGAPESVRQRFLHRAGIIPESLERLDEAAGDHLHHGVERIGLVAYDLIAREEVFFHNRQAFFHWPMRRAARSPFRAFIRRAIAR